MAKKKRLTPAQRAAVIADIKAHPTRSFAATARKHKISVGNASALTRAAGFRRKGLYKNSKVAKDMAAAEMEQHRVRPKRQPAVVSVSPLLREVIDELHRPEGGSLEVMLDPDVATGLMALVRGKDPIEMVPVALVVNRMFRKWLRA